MLYRNPNYFSQVFEKATITLCFRKLFLDFRRMKQRVIFLKQRFISNNQNKLIFNILSYRTKRHILKNDCTLSYIGRATRISHSSIKHPGKPTLVYSYVHSPVKAFKIEFVIPTPFGVFILVIYDSEILHIVQTICINMHKQVFAIMLNRKIIHVFRTNDYIIP